MAFLWTRERIRSIFYSLASFQNHFVDIDGFFGNVLGSPPSKYYDAF